jgi:diguanylate cyclase (GGDEF)-like protein
MDAHDESAEPRALVSALWRHAHDLVVDAERDGRVRDANPAAREWFARADLRLLDVVHPDHGPRLLATLAGDTPASTDFLFAAPGGAGWRVLEVTATVPLDESTVLVGRDVTIERRTTATLTHHRHALTLVARKEPIGATLDALARSIEYASDGARVAILVVQGDDLELAAAPSLRADVSRALARVPGAALGDAFPAPGALTGRLAEIASELGVGFGWSAPVADDEHRHGVLLLFPGAKRFPSAGEQAALEAAVPLASVAIGAATAEATTRRAERTDALTGVLARPAFVAELGMLARRARDVLGVLIVAVDDLAAVNHTHGLAAGDALLQAVASRLGAMIRGRDLVGRISGHRFAVACVGVRDPAALEQFAARVQTVLAEPVVTGAGVLPVAVSVCTHLRLDAASDPTAVLATAESADHPSGAEVSEPDVADLWTERRRQRGSGRGQTDR